MNSPCSIPGSKTEASTLLYQTKSQEWHWAGGKNKNKKNNNYMLLQETKYNLMWNNKFKVKGWKKYTMVILSKKTKQTKTEQNTGEAVLILKDISE